MARKTLGKPRFYADTLQYLKALGYYDGSNYPENAGEEHLCDVNIDGTALNTSSDVTDFTIRNALYCPSCDCELLEDAVDCPAGPICANGAGYGVTVPYNSGFGAPPKMDRDFLKDLDEGWLLFLLLFVLFSTINLYPF